jgi:hypothetical protein
VSEPETCTQSNCHCQEIKSSSSLENRRTNAAPDTKLTWRSVLAGKLAAFISVRIAFWNEQQQLYRIILSINRQEQHRKRSIAWQKEVVLYLQSMFADAAKQGRSRIRIFLPPPGRRLTRFEA